MSLKDKLVIWMKKEVVKSGRKGVVLGLSGGVDSAVVASVAVRALGKDNVFGLIMPCHSDPVDEKFAVMLAKKLGIRAKKVKLDRMYDEFKKILPKGEKMALANLKPRLRMCTLYYYAHNLGYLVAGTGNKSELTIGYFTKYGDGGVDMLPIGGLLKTEVWAVAKELEVPKEIIERAPTAGLWDGQTDEGEMGVLYKDLDAAITCMEKKKEHPRKDVMAKVKKMMKASDHKRQKMPVFTK